MTLNTPIFAIIDPATREILGNGDSVALYATEPDRQELALVRRHCRCPGAVVVRVRVEEE